MNKTQYEFTAQPFETDVQFIDWFRDQRKKLGHETIAETAREVGVPANTVRQWLVSDKYPRTHLPIVKLAQWSETPIRLIRGMIEYQKQKAEEKVVVVPEYDKIQPWRAVPYNRQQRVLLWLTTQIDFFEGQGGDFREFAATLKSARVDLKNRAEETRSVRKEVEVPAKREATS